MQRVLYWIKKKELKPPPNIFEEEIHTINHSYFIMKIKKNTKIRHNDINIFNKNNSHKKTKNI